MPNRNAEVCNGMKIVLVVVVENFLGSNTVSSWKSGGYRLTGLLQKMEFGLEM